MALLNKDNILLSDYSSDRIPDYKEDYSPLCNQILLEYSIWDFDFLWNAGFCDCKNNQLGCFRFCYPQYCPENFIEKCPSNLFELNSFFDDENLKRGYEGAYNTLIYIINSIYKEINFYDGQVDNKEQLFKDIALRKEFVKENFCEIVRILYETKKKITGSRLSVGNLSLNKNCSKTGNIFSEQQLLLVNAIARGCSLTELENNNYEGAKRLIYVPYNKI